MFGISSFVLSFRIKRYIFWFVHQMPAETVNSTGIGIFLNWGLSICGFVAGLKCTGFVMTLNYFRYLKFWLFLDGVWLEGGLCGGLCF
mgnify:CR=1 FL=1